MKIEINTAIILSSVTHSPKYFYSESIAIMVHSPHYFLRLLPFRLLWPEGVVLFFNTVANRSSEWGVLSWHWYFSNALPKVTISYLFLFSCDFENNGFNDDMKLRVDK